MSIKELMNVPAKESTLFWVFIGIIVGVILIIVLRDLFLWYFRVNELRDQIEELHKKLDALSAGGSLPSQTVQPASHEAEIAVAIAAAANAKK